MRLSTYVPVLTQASHCATRAHLLDPASSQGVLHSRGARVLFADADGASSFPSLATLQTAMDAVEIPYPSVVPASVPASPNPGAEAESSAVESVPSEGLRHRVNQTNGRPAGKATDGKASEDEPVGKLGIAIGSRAHLVSTDLVVKVRRISNPPSSPALQAAILTVLAPLLRDGCGGRTGAAAGDHV